MPSNAWALAIDFGTTNTAAAWRRRDGRSEVLQIDGMSILPSVVYLDPERGLIAGRAADALSAVAPHRAVRSPKRRLTDPTRVVLDGRAFDPSMIAATVLGHIVQRAVGAIGSPPDDVVLTHPGSWGRSPVERLRHAAGIAGIADPLLVAEPVAAATALAHTTSIPDGGHLAVYDLGGGTFDTAIVQATSRGPTPMFKLVGRAGGDAHLGGELFDELIAERLLARLDPATASALETSTDPLWERAHSHLLTEARRVKEAIAHQRGEIDVVLALPTGFVPVRLGRDEIDDALDPPLQQTADALGRVLGENGIDSGRLHGIFLIGGCSNMLRVESTVRHRFPTVPILRAPDPKTVVALGALDAAAALSSSSQIRSDLGKTTSGRGAPVVVSAAALGADPSFAPPQTVKDRPAAPLHPSAVDAASRAGTVGEAPHAGSPTMPAGAVQNRESGLGGDHRRKLRLLVGFVVLALFAAIGGVAFVVRDHSDSGRSVPETTEVPPADSVAPETHTSASSGGSNATPAPFTTTVWSADGSVLARAFDDQTVRLFDPRSGRQRAVLPGRSATLSPDGRQAATVSLDKVLRVVTTDGADNATFIGAKSFAWSPDGRNTALLRSDGMIGIRSSDGHETDRVFHQPTPRINAFEWSPDGERFLVRDVDLSYVWDPDEPKAFTVLADAEFASNLTWAPNGARLAGIADNGTLQLWNAESGAVVASAGSRVKELWWSPDGTRIAVHGDFDGATLRVLDGESLDTTFIVESLGRSFAWSPDGDRYIVSRFDNSVRIFNALDGNEIVQVNAQGSEITSLSWSPDGEFIASDGPGRIDVWDPGDGELISTPTS